MRQIRRRADRIGSERNRKSGCREREREVRRSEVVRRAEQSSKQVRSESDRNRTK